MLHDCFLRWYDKCNWKVHKRIKTVRTLVCFWREIPTCTVLFWSARLLILRKPFFRQIAKPSFDFLSLNEFFSGFAKETKETDFSVKSSWEVHWIIMFQKECVLVVKWLKQFNFKCLKIPIQLQKYLGPSVLDARSTSLLNVPILFSFNFTQGHVTWLWHLNRWNHFLLLAIQLPTNLE